MKKLSLIIALFLSAVVVNAQSKTVVDIAKGSGEHTVLVQAVVAAELAETLTGDGPFTVFAPTNAAFEKLPKGTVGDLLKPESKEKLQSILTYHVVAGNLDANAVLQAIEKGQGKAAVTTVQGGELYVTLEGENVILMDSSGNKATVTATDLKASNGVVHVIDTVVMP
jgi:uncharacterized surface protein with fasciclin (FAS1) repeats